MLIGVDHLVLATDDPDSAAEALRARLGLEPGAGGRHERMGTFNRLIWLGDAYLELVGVFDRTLALESWFGRPIAESLERGGGLVTWAVAVDDLDGALRWAPPGSGWSDAQPGERRRPDGRVVRWRLAHPETPDTTQPIVIEHDVTAAEWTPPERADRADARHPVGGRVRLAGFEVVTPSPAVAAGRLRRLLAAAVEPAGRGAVRVRFGAQEARFAVNGPSDPAVVDLVADVPLRTRVTRIGDCRIRLRGTLAAVLPEPADEADAAAETQTRPEPDETA